MNAFSWYYFFIILSVCGVCVWQMRPLSSVSHQRNGCSGPCPICAAHPGAIHGAHLTSGSSGWTRTQRPTEPCPWDSVAGLNQHPKPITVNCCLLFTKNTLTQAVNKWPAPTGSRANERSLRAYLATGWVAKESIHVQYDVIYMKSHDRHTLLTELTKKSS